MFAEGFNLQPFTQELAQSKTGFNLSNRLRAALLPDSAKKSSKGTLWLDLDGTLKEYSNYPWPDQPRKVAPEAIAGLRALHNQDIHLAITTDQSMDELKPWLDDVSKLTLGSKLATARDLIAGPIILERGNIFLEGTNKPVVINPSETPNTFVDINNILRENIIQDSKSDWGAFVLGDTASKFEHLKAVRLRMAAGNRLLSNVIAIQGPSIDEMPEIAQYYQDILTYIKNLTSRYHRSSLEITMDNRGIILFSPIGSDKINAKEYLMERDLFDPKKSVFACDGIQDLAWAQSCAVVISPNNAVQPIKEIATFVSDYPIGMGFAQAIHAFAPDQYNQSLAQIYKEALEKPT